MKILRNTERRDSLYEVIKKAAKDKGMSISQVEEEAGLARSSICKWKKSSPSIATLEKVADALGLSVTTLINRAKKAGKEES